MPTAWVFNGAESATLVGPHGRTAASHWALGGSLAAPESAAQPGARRDSLRRPGQRAAAPPRRRLDRLRCGGEPLRHGLQVCGQRLVGCHQRQHVGAGPRQQVVDPHGQRAAQAAEVAQREGERGAEGDLDLTRGRHGRHPPQVSGLGHSLGAQRDDAEPERAHLRCHLRVAAAP